jgi:hypothetical protein
LTDDEMVQEGSLYGTWLEPVNATSQSARTAGWPRRIAVVGGQKFDEAQAERWLQSLRVKYPNATVVTGSARGAEAFIRERAVKLGFTVAIPEVPEGYPSEWQVTDIVVLADVIVTVGSEKASRAALAIGIHKRVDAGRRGGRPHVHIAAPPKRESPPKRASRGSSVRA